MTQVEQLLRDDRWTLVEAAHPDGPGLLRFRSPVPAPADVAGYRRLVTVVWAYAAESGGAMPDAAASAAMGAFEDRLCGAVERDAHAVLAAVLTFDGARQWVFYTRDVAEFGRRLSAMPDRDGRPYPIELRATDDPAWSYLRKRVLRRPPCDA